VPVVQAPDRAPLPVAQDQAAVPSLSLLVSLPCGSPFITWETASVNARFIASLASSSSSLCPMAQQVRWKSRPISLKCSMMISSLDSHVDCWSVGVGIALDNFNDQTPLHAVTVFDNIGWTVPCSVEYITRRRNAICAPPLMQRFDHRIDRVSCMD